MKLERRYVAEAAHQLLAGVPDGHPCRRLHGHRYIIVIGIAGDVHPETGMLLEYADIDRRIGEVLSLVDHRFVNELGFNALVIGRELICTPIAGVTIHETDLAQAVRDNSTVENLIAWFVAELRHRFPREATKVGPSSLRPPQVVSVEIEEDEDSKAGLWAGESVRPTA